MALDMEAMRQQFIQEVQALMIPIDIEALRAEGILGKRKGSWYEVMDMARLPQHVLKQVNAVKTVTGPHRPTKTMVKFMKVSKRLEQVLKNLTGQEEGGEPIA